MVRVAIHHPEFACRGFTVTCSNPSKKAHSSRSIWYLTVPEGKWDVEGIELKSQTKGQRRFKLTPREIGCLVMCGKEEISFHLFADNTLCLGVTKTGAGEVEFVIQQDGSWEHYDQDEDVDYEVLRETIEADCDKENA